MKTILINTETGKLINGVIYPDGYRAKYPQGKLKHNEAEAQVIETPRPDFNPDTHKVIQLEWEIDTIALTYTRKWEVVPLSDYEIALREWVHPEYAKRIRVLDNKALKIQMTNVLIYWDEEGMPRDMKNGYIRLWCNQILPEHTAFIDSANEFLAQFGEQVYEENRPEILNEADDEPFNLDI